MTFHEYCVFYYSFVKNTSEPPLGALNVLEDLRVKDTILFLPRDWVLEKVVIACQSLLLLEVLVSFDDFADVNNIFLLDLFLLFLMIRM